MLTTLGYKNLVSDKNELAKLELSKLAEEQMTKVLDVKEIEKLFADVQILINLLLTDTQKALLNHQRARRVVLDEPPIGESQELAQLI